MTLPRIDVPTYEIEIPSSKAKIRIRAMIAKEEKILLIAKEGSDQGDIISAIRQIVNNCIVTPKFDVDTLAIFDIEWIFMKIRSVSVSNVVQTAYVDNEDKETYPFGIDLDKVEVQFPDNLNKVFKIDDNNSITMKYPPATLYANKDFLKSTGEAMVDLLIKASIDSVNGGSWISETPEAQNEFIDSLPVKVYESIRQFLTDLPHMYYKIEYKNKMDHDREIVLSSLSDFFQF